MESESRANNRRMTQVVKNQSRDSGGQKFELILKGRIAFESKLGAEERIPGQEDTVRET